MPLPPLAAPPSLGRRLTGLLKGLPVVCFLIATLLLFNVAQTASLVLLPFSQRAFRAFNRWAADTWWGWCVIAARLAHGVRIDVTGDDVPPRENAIVVANHQQMPDITFLMAYARTNGRLGDLKWFVKKSLKYVPGVGWGMVFLDCLFVERRWAEDRASINRVFARISEHRVPLWLVSFVEGTRMSPAKLRASRAYAETVGAPPPRHVLIPRTKGFVASVQGLRGHLQAVYDVTIGYERGVPTLWQYAKGFAPVAHLHVRRYPVAELPSEDEELAAWLRRRFEEKDELLERYYETGAFVPSGARGARGVIGREESSGKGRDAQ